MNLPKPTNDPRCVFIPEGTLRPDEARDVIQIFTDGEWVDIGYPLAAKGWKPQDVQRAAKQSERRDLMNAHPPEIDQLIGAKAYFSWSWEGCGFGQLSFAYDRETGAISCSNECMSRENVRKLLHAFADYVADNAVLDC